MSELGNKHRLFWYVTATYNLKACAFAVAATSESAARRLVQRSLKGVKVDRVAAVAYSHVWQINHRMPE